MKIQLLTLICLTIGSILGLIQIMSRRIDILQQEVFQLKAQQSQNK